MFQSDLEHRLLNDFWLCIIELVRDEFGVQSNLLFINDGHDE